MNENALKHFSMTLDAYSEVIKGIFAVRGLGHGRNSFVSKINIAMEPGMYADSLRLLIQNLSSTFKQITKNDLDKIVFELDDYYLILRRKTKSKAGIPLFLSILAVKNEGLDIVDTICDELSEELFMLLR
jgi:hypothetical protein